MVYQFRCSVCEGKFSSKGSWLRHLLEPVHSDLARAELIKNWSGEETRKCLIVVYSKQAVGKDGRILQFFSKDRYKGIVTDFVCWKERPGIGFIQFESRKVAKRMIASLDSHQIVLDNQQFQFRRADNFLDLEWDELLPFHLERVEENKDPFSEVPPEPKDNPFKENFKDLKQRPNITDTFKNSNGRSGYNSFLENLLDSVESQVKIPIRSSFWAIRTVTNLHRVLSKAKLIKEGEEISVSLIRNFCLGLKYHSRESDLPFVAVQVLKKSEGELVNYQKKFTVAKLANLFKKAEMEGEAYANTKKAKFRICHDSHVKTLLKCVTGMKVNCTGTISKGIGTKQTHLPFSIDFTLSGNVLLAGETQLWHLTKYLISFDERCDALLQVVYFWANLNSINIVPENRSLTNSTPDPLGLTWMVLFFLYASDHGNGRTIIPTPSEILDRNDHHHEPIYFGRPGSLNYIDIGFTPDQDFKNGWQKKNGSKCAESTWSVEIINLVYKFFCFWDGFSEESWIINTREGKYYRSEEFFMLKMDQNNPSNEDFLQLQKKQCERFKNWKEKGVIVRHRGILHMSNPFNIFWRIPLFHDALKHFKPTKDKLQVFLNGLETCQLDNVNPDMFVQSLFKEQEGK